LASVATLLAIRWDGRAYGAEIEVSSATHVAKAMETAGPGDVLIMTDGTWSNQQIRVRGNSGTAEQPIVLRARTPGKVLLTGNSTLRLSDDHSAHHITVSGLCFRDGHTPEDAGIVILVGGRHNRVTDCAVIDYKRAGNYLRLWGEHNRVDHCFFRGKTTLSPTVNVSAGIEPNYHRIDHNYFGYRPPFGRNGAETIQIGNSRTSMRDSRTVVEYNLFEQCDGEGEIIANKSCENVYRYNTFRNCAGHLSLRHGKRCVVDGNFFLGEGNRVSGGVRVIGEDHKVINNYFTGTRFRGAIRLVKGVSNSPPHGYFQVKNALIAFNTFIDNDCPCLDLEADCRLGRSHDYRPGILLPENVTIANNILRGETGLLIKGEGPGIVWAGNLAYGGALGISTPDGIEVVDPKLVKGEDGLWRPEKNSPVIGAACGDYPGVNKDIDGQPREGKKDVGCDQASNAAVINRPLTPADAGPSWLARN